MDLLRASTTVRVSGLSHLTREEQIYEIFSKCGDIRRIVMGLVKATRTPAGFCFVIFYTKKDAEDGVKYLHSTIVDGCTVAVASDPGYTPGREYESAESAREGDEQAPEYQPPGRRGRLGSSTAIGSQGSVSLPQDEQPPAIAKASDGKEIIEKRRPFRQKIVYTKPSQAMDWQDPYNNPHVAQVYLNKGAGYEARTDIPFQRILTEDYPCETYRRRQNEHKSVIHWGQRKLLLSEIEFLNMYGKAGHPVVYAGAAPGTHIKYLAKLFPELDFVLVDPAPFNLQETDQITLRQELFTDEVAQEFAGRSPLFISDIRAADWQEMGDVKNEAQVQDDMDAQWRWHDIMQPLKSMLKFRLSWQAGKTRYLKGTIFLPVWGPITTTEARLIPEGNETCEYDNTKYEQQMFYFNTRARVGLYEHDGAGVGICHCYDCTSEVHILTNYLQSRDILPGGGDDPAALKGEISKLTGAISAGCAARRTLADPNSDPEERKQGIRQRQWIGGVPAYTHAKRKRDVEKGTDPSSQYGPGHKLLTAMGYKQGHGIGANGTGIATPLQLSEHKDRRGLGFPVQNHVTRGEMTRAISAGSTAAGQGEAASSSSGANRRSQGSLLQDRSNMQDRPAADRFKLILTKNPAQPHQYKEVSTGNITKRPPDVSGWEVKKRSSCDAYYYYNPATSASQYEVPLPFDE